MCCSGGPLTPPNCPTGCAYALRTATLPPGYPPMRLSPDDIAAIHRLVQAHLGADAGIWLFGSRLDDAARGGNVDLYVEPERLPDENLLLARQALRRDLERHRCPGQLSRPLCPGAKAAYHHEPGRLGTPARSAQCHRPRIPGVRGPCRYSQCHPGRGAGGSGPCGKIAGGCRVVADTLMRCPASTSLSRDEMNLSSAKFPAGGYSSVARSFAAAKASRLSKTHSVRASLAARLTTLFR